MNKIALIVFLLLGATFAWADGQIPAQTQPAAEWNESNPFPGGEISPAIAFQGDGRWWTLATSAISADFILENGVVRLEELQNKLTGEKLPWNDSQLFTLQLDGRRLTSSQMKWVDGPAMVNLPGDPKLARLGQRLSGKELTGVLEDSDTGLRVTWSAILLDGSNYLRQEITLTSTKPVKIADIEMIHGSAPDAKVDGYTDGSPIVAGNWFMGIEHPMARNAVDATQTGLWSPGDMIQRQIVCNVVGLQGGDLTLQFNYASGNHGITVSKVELLDGDKVLAVDAHEGFSGIAAHDNTYRLKVPSGVTTATLRATLGGPPQDTNSYGKLALTNGRWEAASGSPAVIATWPRQLTLTPGLSWKISTGIGVAPAGQLRRAFAYYLQRERAHPYRQYWHYNSWFDLNIGRNDIADPLKRMNEQEALDVVQAFNTELFKKRGVGLNGFVWDDGWDDWNSLWQFHKGFPNGFGKIADAAKNEGAGMGAWLSPWGGYGQSQQMRVNLGRTRGYETNGGGFSLAGPRYYAAFRDSCLGMIHDCGMNYFKFDGIGGGAFATGAPPGVSGDLDGLVRMIGDLRSAKPDVFINATVGTWASPYWTFFADSIWRQGGDCGFAGVGNARERWITYKDSYVHDRFADRSPLFPMNSMMYHGVVVGPTADPGQMPPPAKDLASFEHEMRMAAGYSSGLGELYVTPRLMTPEAWDCMAECIRWSRAKKNVMVDSHWIGGSPAALQVYGLAAWHPSLGGVITLRNPSDKPQVFALKIENAFELPAKSKMTFTLHSPWKQDAARPVISAEVGTPCMISLEPFDVTTLEADALKERGGK